MSIVVVVSNARDWPLAIAGAEVVEAHAYLTDPAHGNACPARVINLCKSYRYQSHGYYVSLLAEARGHKPLPCVSTIEDLHSRNLVRLLTTGLDDLAQKALAPIKSESFILSIYFGRNLAARYDILSRRIFDLLRAPLLQARFMRRDGVWHVESVRPLAASDIPAAHRDFVVAAARDYFLGHHRRPRRRPACGFSLAILHDRDNPLPASNEKAIRKFEKAAQALGIQCEVIGHGDLGRLPLFDGLFIRDNTFINHYTYRFSRRAAAEGLVVIDDPASILRCNNKVYLAELLARHRIPTPRTLVVHRDNLRDIVPALGLPVVLKRPDSSLSLGVVKAETEAQLADLVKGFLEKSDLIVAQEYLPTEFDWRVGILDRRPLFVCRYYMAPGHWQIVKHDPRGGHYIEGRTVAHPLDAVPREVVRMALKAANLIGDGFYGVDLKQVGRRCLVMEVNDNPNVDAGNEDQVLKDGLYREVMTVFAARMAARRR
jgi:glutathione synthase/RimK-type ligase-like ATP-grasp enzyme